ncbi:hypothetical protein NL676_005571 [Syzygium grande]|nr:hypothetical protein NL676_005571 [Syzygium grande]
MTPPPLPSLTIARNHRQGSIATTDPDTNGNESSPRPETNPFTPPGIAGNNHPSNPMANVVGLRLDWRC